jgi:hypothetical protein
MQGSLSVQGGFEGGGIVRGADRRGRGAGRDAFHEAGQDLTRADLIKRFNALGGHIGHALAPADGSGDLADEGITDRNRVGDGSRFHIGHHRDGGGIDGHTAQGLAHGIRGRLHEGAMEGSGHGQHHGTLGTFGLGNRHGPFHGRLMARNDHLGTAVVVGRIADLALRRLAGDLEGGLVLKPEKRRHGALPHWNGALHGIAADPQQAGGIGDGEAAGGGERRIFAQRVAGDKGGMFPEIEAGLGLQNPDRRQAHGHQGRLRVGRQGQLLRRSFPHDGGKFLGESLVHLVENGPGLRKGIGKGFAHSNRLAPLTGENECALHQERNP